MFIRHRFLPLNYGTEGRAQAREKERYSHLALPSINRVEVEKIDACHWWDVRPRRDR